MLSSVLVIVPFLAGTFGANDWSTLCVTGQCSYGTQLSCELPNSYLDLSPFQIFLRQTVPPAQ
jgi:hypothetical protein